MHYKQHQAIEHHFTGHRIIIWYDDNGASRDLFNGFDCAGVKKAEIRNIELALKYRFLRREPETRFLLYSAGARRPVEDNWLLDLVLSHSVFAGDRIARAAMWRIIGVEGQSTEACEVRHGQVIIRGGQIGQAGAGPRRHPVGSRRQ